LALSQWGIRPAEFARLDPVTVDRLALAYVRRTKWEAGVMAVAIWGGLGDTFQPAAKGQPAPRSRKPVQWVSQGEMMKLMGFDPGKPN
jgi:hypothetical protein